MTLARGGEGKMAEYIDRKDVIELITRRYENPEICTHEINSIPAADVAPVVHARRIKTRKHRWKTYSNGEIDFCAWDSGYCNGPLCVDCGEHFCIHCAEKDGGEEAVKQRLEKENCTEKTVCSVCGRYVPEDVLYCHCGAKMDASTEISTENQITQLIS